MLRVQEGQKLGKWDRRFLQLAYEVAQWSKDRSTKCGAVLVRNRRVLSTGYNGFPPSLNDEAERWHERPAKYYATEHAERNAVYNAAMHGVTTAEAFMYIYGLYPCSRCARAMVLSGVERVVFGYNTERFPTGKSPHMEALDFEIAQDILHGIQVVEVGRSLDWWETRV